MNQEAVLEVPFAMWPEATAADADQYDLVGMEVATSKGKKQQRGKRKRTGWLLATRPEGIHEPLPLHQMLPPELF